MRNWEWLRKMNARVDWVQLVAGIEAGRVNDEFDVSELHSDMNVGGVFGFRMMVNHLVVRADLGISDEAVAIQMTIDQPF